MLPNTMALDTLLISSNWLSACSSALRNADVTALTDLFLPNGWLRDILVFTWDIRSLEGHEKIATYLADRLLEARITDVQLDNTPHLAPRVDLGVEFVFTFECHRGHGRAYVRLTPDADGVHRAFTMLTELADLRGHEELGRLPLRDDVTGLPGRDMQKDYADMVADVENNPYVIIGERPSDIAGCPANCMRNCNFDVSWRCTDRSTGSRPVQADEHTYAGD